MKIKEFSGIYGVKEDTVRAYIRRNKDKFPNLILVNGCIDLDESACRILAVQYKTNKEKRSLEFEKLKEAILLVDHNMRCMDKKCSDLEKENEGIQKSMNEEINRLKGEIRRLRKKIVELEEEKQKQNEKNTLIDKIFK